MIVYSVVCVLMQLYTISYFYSKLIGCQSVKTMFIVRLILPTFILVHFVTLCKKRCHIHVIRIYILEVHYKIHMKLMLMLLMPQK